MLLILVVSLLTFFAVKFCTDKFCTYIFVRTLMSVQKMYGHFYLQELF